jgi:hypothetical protein
MFLSEIVTAVVCGVDGAVSEACGVVMKEVVGDAVSSTGGVTSGRSQAEIIKIKRMQRTLIVVFATMTTSFQLCCQSSL